MTGMRPTGDWDGTVFAHEGFVFGTDQELVDRVVPFAVEGVSRGEPVLVVAGERVRTLLAEQLGQDVCRLAVFASIPARVPVARAHARIIARGTNLCRLTGGSTQGASRRSSGW